MLIFFRGVETTNQINMGRGAPSSPSREKHNVVLFDTIQLNSMFLGLNLQCDLYVNHSEAVGKQCFWKPQHLEGQIIMIRHHLTL